MEAERRPESRGDDKERVAAGLYCSVWGVVVILDGVVSGSPTGSFSGTLVLCGI